MGIGCLQGVSAVLRYAKATSTVLPLNQLLPCQRGMALRESQALLMIDRICEAAIKSLKNALDTEQYCDLLISPKFEQNVVHLSPFLYLISSEAISIF